jgi:hypothetical protein
MMLNARRRLDELEARIGAVEAKMQSAPEGKDRFEVCVFGKPTPRGYKPLDGAAAQAVVDFYHEHNLPMPEVAT